MGGHEPITLERVSFVILPSHRCGCGYAAEAVAIVTRLRPSDFESYRA